MDKDDRRKIMDLLYKLKNGELCTPDCYGCYGDNERSFAHCPNVAENFEKELANLGYQKVGDDEIVIEEIELARLKRSNYREGCVDGRKEIQDQYDALRKQYATLRKENKTLKDDNKKIVDRNFTLSIETCKTKEETRKFLRELYKCEYYTHGRTVIEEIANKYGIETEWIEAYKNYKNELE